MNTNNELWEKNRIQTEKVSCYLKTSAVITFLRLLLLLLLLLLKMKKWLSQWTEFMQLRKEAWKIQDFNGIWTRDLAIPVRCSNQLSYEATDVGSRSIVGS